MPFFSVVIPAYNRATLIERTIQSVLAQEFSDYELIVVDDGSTDGTPDLVASRFGDRVTLLRQQNQGPGAARNLAMHRATGEYLAFLDSDDLWFPWTLRVFHDVATRNGKPSLIASNIWEFSDESDVATQRFDGLEDEAYADHFASSRIGVFVGAGMTVVRRDAILKIGGFTHERINAEDHDLIMRLGTAPGFVRIVAPATLAFRRHEGSITRDIRKTYDGVRQLLAREKRGDYPGGDERRRERIQIITLHVRPSFMACVRAGDRAAAWKLYRESFGAHVALGRWKFLLGAPAEILKSMLK